ncbi:MAG: cell division protein SepF [Clostridia bacterium]|nr:cell division protein SepF [Clostridia bacterium]
MGNKFMNKFWEMIGVNDGEDDEAYEYADTETTTPYVEEKEQVSPTTNKRNKVVGMPGMQQVKVVISQPSTFEQSEEICEHLKEKKSVIMNLEYVNKDVARRIIDFVGGAAYALDGNMQKISNSIFLVAPFNYEITNEVMKEDIKNKLSVSWIK